MYDLRSRLWYNLGFSVSWSIMTLAFDLRSVGSRNVPQTGPLLILANHESYFDPLVIGLAVRRQISYLARKTLFRNPLFAALIRSLGAVPIDHEGMGREGLQQSIHILQEGNPLLVFPEGNRTDDGEMVPFKPGILLVLRRAPVPILPVGVAGGFESFPKHRKVPTASPIYWPPTGGGLAVSIGKVIPPERYQGQDRDEMLTMLFDAVQAEVRKAEQLVRR